MKKLNKNIPKELKQVTTNIMNNGYAYVNYQYKDNKNYRLLTKYLLINGVYQVLYIKILKHVEQGNFWQQIDTKEYSYLKVALKHLKKEIKKR